MFAKRAITIARVWQVHYDNVDDDANKLDTSGFRLYYTEQLRQHDAAVLEIGDPNVRAQLKKASTALAPGSSKITFTHDAASCTGSFTADNVTVFTRFLHMHEVGTHMRTTQYRDRQVLRQDIADYYDFRQAGALEPVSTGAGFVIKKGDTFKVECWYSNPDAKARYFGLGSRDEMCIDFIYYYPRFASGIPPPFDATTSPPPLRLL